MAAGGLVVGVAALAGACASDTERVTRHWTVAEVGEAGSAQVTEVIDYSFGALPQGKHGIFRDIPGLDPAAPVSVTSPDAPDDAEVSPTADGIRIRIGDPGTTVSGDHRYRIGYELPGVRRGEVVDWEAVGTRWEVGMDEAEVHLLTPFALDDAACFTGAAGSSQGCDLRRVEPGHVVATVEGLDAGEGVSIEGRAGAPLGAPPAPPAPPTGAPDDPGTGLLPPAGTAVAAALVAAVPTSVLVRRAGREHVAPGGAATAAYAGHDTPPGSEIRVDAAELGRMATTEFAPPDGVSPAQGGIVLREDVRDEHKVAWLVQAAIDGVIDIDDRAGTTIRRVAGAPAAPDQQDVLARMFATGPVVELGRYDRHFASGWSLLGSRLAAWRQSSGLWDRRADARKVVVRVLGIVAAVIGAVVAVVGGIVAGWVGPAGLAVVAAGALLAGAGVAAAVRAWELHVRTAAGSALWLRVESFRRFLAGSEAYHAEEAAKRGVLREYTAWALALGEIDRWSRAVAAAAIPPDVAGVHYAYMAPLLLASTTATATAPSSSGGGMGGFGGGSVGGGAGGGGGGSW